MWDTSSSAAARSLFPTNPRSSINSPRCNILPCCSETATSRSAAEICPRSRSTSPSFLFFTDPSILRKRIPWSVPASATRSQRRVDLLELTLRYQHLIHSGTHIGRLCAKQEPVPVPLWSENTQVICLAPWTQARSNHGAYRNARLGGWQVTSLAHKRFPDGL